MNNLETILGTKLPKRAPFTMDNFQSSILDKLHLEFFFEKSRFLITPEYGYLLTGEASPQEERGIQNILEERQTEIEAVKEYLIYKLSLYSALIETNSYYISLNGHLLIARFIPLDEDAEVYEVKIYTIGKQDLPQNYRDKLYIGRDFVSFRKLERRHFGLNRMRDSLMAQFPKFRERIHAHVNESEFPALDNDYIQEVEELLADFAQNCNELIERFPPNLSEKGTDTETLINANMVFREVKHVLIEMDSTLREMEKVMFEKELSRAVRYVTKFRKDVTNNINFLTIKVNGRLTDHVNGTHW